MKIGEVCLLTNDVPRLASFYRQLLGVEESSSDETHSDLDVDDGRILSNITRNPLNALLLSNYFEYDAISQRFGFKSDIWADVTEVGRGKMEEATRARLARYYKDMPT